MLRIAENQLESIFFLNGNSANHTYLEIGTPELLYLLCNEGLLLDQLTA